LITSATLFTGNLGLDRGPTFYVALEVFLYLSGAFVLIGPPHGEVTIAEVGLQRGDLQGTIHSHLYPLPNEDAVRGRVL